MTLERMAILEQRDFSVGCGVCRGHDRTGPIGFPNDGQQIVYTGACGTGGMRWTVGGDVSPKYLPES